MPDGTNMIAEPASPALKVAIVHEWLSTYAGSERVLEQLIACYPHADIFAVVDFLPDDQRAWLGGRRVKTSFIQRLPFARKFFRHYLGLMPLAVEQFNLTGYDLIVTSSHSVAKGVITGPDQVHVSYVHSPMRYAWDMQHQYLEQSNMLRGIKSVYARWLLSRLRQWDVRTGPGVDVFVANSRYIARRIQKAYRRDAKIVYPPVDVERFAFQAEKSDYYLAASRLVPYKRIDLIAAAFAAMPDRKLVIVGEGPAFKQVEEIARNAPNITMKGKVGGDELYSLMASARALVAAAEEDFGIVTVEAQACGTPVISFDRGGAVDIVRPAPGDGATGVLFGSQTAAAICEAVDRFEALEPGICPRACRLNATRFSAEIFRLSMLDVIAESLRTHCYNALQGTNALRPASASDAQQSYASGALQTEMR